MSTPKIKLPLSNLQLVSDKEVAISLERLIDSVVMEVTAPGSALLPQQVKESSDDPLGINSLPNETILEIFAYLKQNQLGQIARVCSRWNVLTKSPVLWKKVNVKFSPSHRFQTKIFKSFINGLPPCVTSIRLDFTKCNDWIEPLRITELSVKLQEKCPQLKELILIESKLSNSLPTVLDFCTQFLKSVKNLVFHSCEFPSFSERLEFGGTSTIDVLDLSGCSLGRFNKPQFSRLPNLKQLCLYYTDAYDSWFLDDTSFLDQLHVLDVGYSNVTARTFPAIQNHGHNLKELYLCWVNLFAHDLTFNNSVPPHLKTICLGGTYVACEDVVSLIQSCPSLQTVYVNEDVAESFAVHPYVVANRCKSEIVKVIDLYHSHNVDYLHIEPLSDDDSPLLID